MKYFSAQYVITNCGPPLRRAIITAEDDGTIQSVEDTRGKLSEKHSVEFYNGIIIPGFVNCHCHLELSYMKDEIGEGIGLSNFLADLTAKRDTVRKNSEQAIVYADEEMFKEGIVLCADICNSASTFPLKKDSRIKYISLLEVFGVDPLKTKKRINEILEVADQAKKFDIPHWIVPHTVYSVSLPLFREIKKYSRDNLISSIHFMESSDEVLFLENSTGTILDTYRKFLSPVSGFEKAKDHISAILKEITPNGNLILVHNTYVEKEQIRSLKKRNGIFWCLCPNSNLFIEKKIPPAEMLISEGCEIVIGTDSLSSNRRLSIIEELKTLQHYFPHLRTESLIRWATVNGAKALCEEKWAGSIEPGKRPGLLLIRNMDLQTFRFLPQTNVKRLL
jgi:aminodeoxyfutalosine deaminase